MPYNRGKSLEISGDSEKEVGRWIFYLLTMTERLKNDGVGGSAAAVDRCLAGQEVLSGTGNG